MKKLALAAFSLLLIGAGCFSQREVFPAPEPMPDPNPVLSEPVVDVPDEFIVTDYYSCVAAGNPVMESYPEQCSHDGVTYVRDIGNAAEKANLIRVDSPRPGDYLTSPLNITGEARGTWFSEASFPVSLYDEAGDLLAQGTANAVGDWMTEEFVPFTVTIDFPVPLGGEGLIILEKDNPSGLPENDDALTVPVRWGIIGEY